jgi:hypothetical protein
VEDTGGVHGGQKAVGGRGVLRNNDLGVAGAVLVDVLHGLLQPGHQLHRAGQIAVLQAQLLGGRRPEGQGGRQARTRVDSDALLLQRLADLNRKRDKNLSK